MLPYNKNLKIFARNLRNNQTLAEQILWGKIRKKQLLNVQFYRQKPIYNYIADFYAPTAKLIIELDGKHHQEAQYKLNDTIRDSELAQLNLTILRFSNQQIVQNIQSVIKLISNHIIQFHAQNAPL